MSLTSKIIAPVALFFMLAALASAINIDEFKNHLKKPKGIIIGLLCQFGFLPLCAYLITLAFDMDIVSSVGLVLTGSSPGGTFSNVFSFLIGADLPLSIAMTSASSLLSFAFLTLNGYLYITLALDPSDGLEIDYAGMGISISVLIVGVVFGLLITIKQWMKVKRFVSVLATIFVIILIIGSAVLNLTGNGDIGSVSWKIWISPLLLTTLGWIFGLGMALLVKMSKPSAIAVGIEISNQNTVLAMGILYLTIDDDDTADRAVAIPILYTVLSWSVNLILCVVFYYIGWADITTDDGSERETNICIVVKRLVERCMVYRTMNKSETNPEIRKGRVQTQSNVDIQNTVQVTTMPVVAEETTETGISHSDKESKSLNYTQ